MGINVKLRTPVIKGDFRAGWFEKVSDEIIGLLKLLVFLVLTALIFRSLEFGLIVTASLGFHELGHALALRWFGIDYKVSFGLAGAWTWSPLKARSRLSHLQNIIIHLAGPVFSLLLALIALWIKDSWWPSDTNLAILANFSANVFLLNLLPLGPLTDGGKIAQRMIKSLDNRNRVRAVMLPTVITAMMLIAYDVLGQYFFRGSNPQDYLLGLLLIGVWLAGSLFIEARHTPEQGEDTSKPMTSRQVYFLIIFMWNLLTLGLFIIATTTFWLTPDYVMGSLQNLVVVVRTIVRAGL